MGAREICTLDDLDDFKVVERGMETAQAFTAD